MIDLENSPHPHHLCRLRVCLLLFLVWGREAGGGISGWRFLGLDIWMLGCQECGVGSLFIFWEGLMAYGFLVCFLWRW